MDALIRPATEDDAEEIARIYAVYVEGSAVSFETEAPDAAEMRTRIREAIVDHQWLVGEDRGRLVGYAYSGPFHQRPAYRWSVEVSVYVDPDAHRRGLGRRLVRALVDDARDRGFVNAFAGIALPNDASVRLFESVGFERIAVQEQVGFKLGAWHDVGWWQLKLRLAPRPPPNL